MTISNFTISAPVYRSADLVVVDGANLGDPISFAEELDLDDTYELRKNTSCNDLMLTPTAHGQFNITCNSYIGRPNAVVHLDCCLTLMSVTGHTIEILILVEVDEGNNVADIYVMPLVNLKERTGYVLVGINRDIARQKFAEIACVSFTRGTLITMASGMQKPIEDLYEGDIVLTRDDGPQPIRWIGQNTTRAVGEFAPVCIQAGTLHNENDLLVSPNHRLFIYQRSDTLGAGQSGLFVRARHLINGDTVVQRDGGFIDYYQLLFDRHQIIYAEGIAAETLLIDTRTCAALPEKITGQDRRMRYKNIPHVHVKNMKPPKAYSITPMLLACSSARQQTAKIHTDRNSQIMNRACPSMRLGLWLRSCWI